MKLVAENLNEAIKHLTPKSEQEIEDILKNIDVNNSAELLHYGVELNNPKYVLTALKNGANKNKGDYYQDFYEVPKVFLRNNYEEGIKYLIDADPKNVDYMLETAAINKIDFDKWTAKLIKFVKKSEENWYTLQHNNELYRAVYYGVQHNNAEAIKLFIQHDIAEKTDIANMLIDLYLDKWFNSGIINPERYTEIIKMAFNNFNMRLLPTSSHKNPAYKGIKSKFDTPDEEREYLQVPHKKKIKAIITLMRAAKMSEKLIKPFVDSLYQNTITIEKLISQLQKYDKDMHIVINYDSEESSLQSSNDYEHILSIDPIKNVSGDLLNIKTTKFRY